MFHPDRSQRNWNRSGKFFCPSCPLSIGANHFRQTPAKDLSHSRAKKTPADSGVEQEQKPLIFQHFHVSIADFSFINNGDGAQAERKFSIIGTELRRRSYQPERKKEEMYFT
jgi:hypothetical protein